MKKKLLVLPVLFLLLASSCKKKDISLDKISADEFDPSFAFPIGTGTMTMQDAITKLGAQSLIYSQNDEEYQLHWYRDVFSLSAAELIDLPAQSFEQTVDIPPGSQTAINAAPAGTSVTFTDQKTEVLSFPNGAELDSIRMESGHLTATVSSTIPHDVELTISIPGLKQNGVSFQEVVSLDYTGSTPVSDMLDVNLGGYALDLTVNGTTDNTLRINYSVKVTSSGQTLNGTEGIDLDFDLNIGTFESVYGYFGNLTINNPDQSIFLDLYNNLDLGEIHFEDVRIKLTADNETGISFQPECTVAIHPKNGGVVPVGGSGINSIPTITKAPAPGQVSHWEHNLTNANTSPSLSDVFQQNPTQVDFTSSIEFNPSGYQKNFLRKDDKVTLSAELILPLYGWAQTFQLRDTLDFDISGTLGLDAPDELDNVDKATIRVLAHNALPVDASLQMYFVDSLYNLIDSVFEAGLEPVLDHGYIDFSLPSSDPNYGRVQSPTKKITDIVLSRQKLQELKDEGARYIVLLVRTNTAGALGNMNIKVYPENYLKLKMAAKLDLKIDL